MTSDEVDAVIASMQAKAWEYAQVGAQAGEYVSDDWHTGGLPAQRCMSRQGGAPDMWTESDCLGYAKTPPAPDWRPGLALFGPPYMLQALSCPASPHAADPLLTEWPHDHRLGHWRDIT